MYIMSELTNMSFPPWRVSKPFTWPIYRESLSSLISWEVFMAYPITSWSSASPVCPPTSCHKALIFSKRHLEKLLLLWVTAQNYDDSHWGMLACPPLIGLQGLPSFAFETVFQRMADTSGLKFWKDNHKWATKRNVQLGKVLPVGTCIYMVITSWLLELLYSNEKSLKLESLGDSSLYP